MTLHTATPEWSIAVPSSIHSYTVVGGSVTLDDRHSIYATATVRLEQMTGAAFAALDPRPLGVRATFTLGQDITDPSPSTQTRDFNLIIYSRAKEKDGTVTLGLASDELLLELRALVGSALHDYYTGVGATARDVVNGVLNDYAGGAALAAGALNGDVTRAIGMTNLIPNPSIETTSAAWVDDAGVSSFARSNTFAARGSWSLRWTCNAGTAAMRLVDRIPVEQLQWYTVACYIRSTVARQFRIRLRYHDALVGGNMLREDTLITLAATPTTGFTRYTIAGQPNRAPEKAVAVQIYFETLGNAAGNIHYLDEIEFVKIPEQAFDRLSYPLPSQAFTGSFLPFVGDLPSYFDGTGDSDAAVAPYYTYAWNGTAHESTSRRTPSTAYAFDLCIMKPGQFARDFVQPIVGITGGRLFCDEARVWRLVADTYTVAGTITLDEDDNLIDADDNVSLTASEDGIPTYFVGAVIAYRYIDRVTGLSRVDYGKAGSSLGPVWSTQVNTPYPGDGPAAAALARAAGRGRAVTPTAFVDYTATPGRAVAITKDGVTLTGRISRVVFTLSESKHEMSITPRELV